MLKVICPITKKVFNCLHCEAIEDQDKCPYMVFDEAIEYALEFMVKLEKEKGKIEKSRS